MRELLKLKEENLLFFDIESARVVDELEPDSPLYNSWEYKVNKEGKMTQQEILDSYKSQAGLYPEFAKVISIVVGVITNGGIKLTTIDNENEFDLLSQFNKGLGGNMHRTLIGFFNVGFDTPFVFKRMLINGIKPNDKLDSSGLKPWELEEVDLSKMWQGTSFNRASLINIATAFGLPSPKEDISGVDVGHVYYNEGKRGLKRISKYCRRDVVTTINIFKKMRLEEPLEIIEGVDLEQIPLITNLFNGGNYGKEEKEELLEKLKSLDKEGQKEAFVVLNALVSGAKGKVTNFKKSDITELKKKL